MASITELPRELLLIIFNFCSASDLLHSVQYVCQVWHDVALMPAIWRKRTLEFYNNKCVDVLKHAKRSDQRLKHACLKHLPEVPFVRGIHLWRYCSNETLSAVCDSCPNLQRLRFDWFNVRCIQFDLASFKCLNYLDIDIANNKLENVINYSTMGFPPLLRTVIFRRGISDGDLPLSLFQKCLYIEHILVTLESELEELVEKCLKSSLTGQAVPGKHNIQTVYVCFSMNAKDILNVICKLPNLRCLALRQNKFQDDKILKYVLNEPCLNLELLDLSFSFNITPHVVFSISHLCPNLVYLSLRRCFVGDAALFAIISNLKMLQYLNLHGTDITSLHFDLIPLQLPNLTDLNLCACRNIKQAKLAELVKAMPNLHIVNPRSGFTCGSNASERKSYFIAERYAL